MHPHIIANLGITLPKLDPDVEEEQGAGGHGDLLWLGH